MQSPGREPSMEDILASIKKVIAEEKELRSAVPPASFFALYSRALTNCSRCSDAIFEC